MTINGYEGRFGLKGWREVRRVGLPHEQCSDDLETLKSSAARLVEAGDYALVELSAWNFELNDWVRLETFEAS